MWIWADEACNVTDFSNITTSWRHNDIVFKIKFEIWDQSIQISLCAEF